MLKNSRSIFTTLGFMISLTLISQVDSSIVPSRADTIADEEGTMTIVEEMPEFPGGQQALIGYLGSNISYPKAAIDKGIEGTVYISFVVDKDGSIIDALRVVNAMPNWSPGKQRGKAVRTQYNLPIRFTLTGPEKRGKKKGRN